MEHCTDRYVAWLNDPEVYKYLETGGNYTIGMLRDYLASVVENKNMLFWAIHLKATGEHIGNIKIDPVNTRHGLGEYGILIGEQKTWGKGYAKEVSKLIIDYCFTKINLRKITLGVVEKNASAVSLYKSLGFEIEGVYKRHGLYGNEYLDILRMAVFNPDFKR
jgi:RimJ/RimL family protein N-acetyltransferase